MAERAIPYEIITPQGTVEINTKLATPADTSFLWLDETPTGMDAAKLRHAIVELAQADGAIVPGAFREALYPAFKGLIVVEADVGRGWFDEEERRTQAELLAARLGSIARADGTLKWTPTGTTQRQRTVRLFDGPEVEQGGMLDPFAFALVAGDPLAYSVTEQTSADITVNGAAVAVTNGGLAPTWPLLRIHGAVTSPILKNNTTGERVELDGEGGLVIANGDHVDIDTHPLVQTVVHSDGSHKVEHLDRAVSTFWRLDPGANQIEFDGSSASGAVKAQVIWRDAWWG